MRRMLQQKEFETCGRFGEYVAPVRIRNLRDVINAERDVVRVRRWSIVPRKERALEPGETLASGWSHPTSRRLQRTGGNRLFVS